MSYSASENTPEQVILNVGGLVVRAECDGGPNLSITAETTANDSNIHIGTIVSHNDNSVGEHRDFWDTGDSVNLAADSTNADNIQGTLTYRNGANDTVVTLTYLLDEQGGFPDRCRAVGNATIL